jgi:hypothetical protein
VTIDTAELTQGTHLAEIQLTSADVPGDALSIPVIVQIPKSAPTVAHIGIFLAVIVR